MSVYLSMEIFVFFWSGKFLSFRVSGRGLESGVSVLPRSADNPFKLDWLICQLGAVGEPFHRITAGMDEVACSLQPFAGSPGSHSHYLFGNKEPLISVTSRCFTGWHLRISKAVFSLGAATQPHSPTHSPFPGLPVSLQLGEIPNQTGKP